MISTWTKLLQRYKFYSVIWLLIIMIIGGSGCKTPQLAITNTEASVRQRINDFIKALNEEDIKTLEEMYADDFFSYEPHYKVSKKELLESIQNGFEQQPYTIQAKIVEIISGPVVATAQIKWVMIGENQEVIFANNLLQVWKREKESWKLSRILFFKGSKVPSINDFELKKIPN